MNTQTAQSSYGGSLETAVTDLSTPARGALCGGELAKNLQWLLERRASRPPWI